MSVSAGRVCRHQTATNAHKTAYQTIGISRLRRLLVVDIRWVEKDSRSLTQFRLNRAGILEDSFLEEMRF